VRVARPIDPEPAFRRLRHVDAPCSPYEAMTILRDERVLSTPGFGRRQHG